MNKKNESVYDESVYLAESVYDESVYDESVYLADDK